MKHSLKYLQRKRNGSYAGEKFQHLEVVTECATTLFCSSVSSRQYIKFGALCIFTMPAAGCAVVLRIMFVK